MSSSTQYVVANSSSATVHSTVFFDKTVCTRVPVPVHVYDG